MVARLPLLLGTPCHQGSRMGKGWRAVGRPWGLLPGPGRGLALYVPTHVQAPASPSPSRALVPWDRPLAPRLLWVQNPALFRIPAVPGAPRSRQVAIPPVALTGPARPGSTRRRGSGPLSATLGTVLGVSPGCGRSLALAGLSPGLGIGSWGVLEVLLPCL